MANQGNNLGDAMSPLKLLNTSVGLADRTRRRIRPSVGGRYQPHVLTSSI